jgi:hypothetical protein
MWASGTAWLDGTVPVTTASIWVRFVLAGLGLLTAAAGLLASSSQRPDEIYLNVGSGVAESSTSP